MIWSAWNNSGAGYGFSVDPADFHLSWTNVTIELPSDAGTVVVTANVSKKSFTKNCPHVIDKRIGRWMRDEGHAPWQTGKPPKFVVEPAGDRRFRVTSVAAGRS